jgi:hypothetical protein
MQNGSPNQTIHKNYILTFGATSFLHQVLCPLKGNNHWHVRFQILTEASTKMKVFWNRQPHSPVEVDRRFRGAYFLYNVCQQQRDYRALYRRRLSSVSAIATAEVMDKVQNESTAMPY